MAGQQLVNDNRIEISETLNRSFAPSSLILCKTNYLKKLREKMTRQHATAHSSDRLVIQLVLFLRRINTEDGSAQKARKDGFEDRVRGVVAHVRDELHKKFKSYRCAVGHIHNMLRDHRSRCIRNSRVARRSGTRESWKIRTVVQVQLRR